MARNLSYHEKLSIIRQREAQPKCTQRELALWAERRFRLQRRPTQATISNILRDRERLLSMDVPPAFRSSRRVRFPELDERVVHWVREQLRQGAGITRAAIREHAADVAQEMGVAKTFSKGWVARFTQRHELSFARVRGGHAYVVVDPAEDAAVSTEMQGDAVEGVEMQEREDMDMENAVEMEEDVQEGESGEQSVENAVEVDQEMQEREVENAVGMEDAEVETSGDTLEMEAIAMETSGDTSDNALEMEEVEMEATVPGSIVMERETEESGALQDTAVGIETIVTESQADGGESDESIGDGRVDGVTVELILLEWLVSPGNYSRWWLQQGDADKPQPLREEINALLSCRGIPKLSSLEIKVQVGAFTSTFEAAFTWLRQTANTYPLEVVDPTQEQTRIKNYVLQMCPHFEKLASVLAPYADSRVNAAMQLNQDDSALAQQPHRGSTPSNDEESEEKAQRRRLFELECQRLQSEIETKNVQLLLEKALARQKLLDAGVSAEEVDRIFPR